MDGAEVAKHNTSKSCYIVLQGTVYDVTSYLEEHPGGAAILLSNAGQVCARITWWDMTEKKLVNG